MPKITKVSTRVEFFCNLAHNRYIPDERNLRWLARQIKTTKGHYWVQRFQRIKDRKK